MHDGKGERKDNKYMSNTNLIDMRNVSPEELNEINLDGVNLDVPAPELEPQRQYYFMAKARHYVNEMSKKAGRPMSFFTQTFGCPTV